MYLTDKEITIIRSFLNQELINIRQHEKYFSYYLLGAFNFTINFPLGGLCNFSDWTLKQTDEFLEELKLLSSRRKVLNFTIHFKSLNPRQLKSNSIKVKTLLRK